MTWGNSRYNCAGLPALSTYQQAKAKWDSTAHIRGRANHERPLGKNRRFSWYQIREHQTSVLVDGDPLGQFITTYGCMLYPRGNDWTPTIEFFPNNDIKLNVQWHCPTSMDFVNYILHDTNLHIDSLEGKWYVGVGKKGESPMWYPLVKDMVFKSTGEFGMFEPANVQAEHKLVAKRKVLNAIRKRIRHFIDYGKTALSMSNEIEKLEELELAKYGFAEHTFEPIPRYWWNDERRKMHRVSQQTLLKHMESTDVEANYVAMVRLAMSAGRYSYRANAYKCTPEAFVSFIDEVIKHAYAEEIFEKVEVPVGKAFKDRNSRYLSFK